MSTPTPQPVKEPEKVSISPLLNRLAYKAKHIEVVGASAEEIASSFALIFENRLSIVQCSSFLTALHFTGKDQDPDVIARCARRMREAAAHISPSDLKAIVKRRGRKEGTYRGGFCDIVGTGGDGHSTFNISTTASIVASPLLLVAKHGNRAQTSLSGSADLLAAIASTPPAIYDITASNITEIYTQSNYAFLFAPNFHPGMKHVSPVRRELGLRTIFNLLGPLANPVEHSIEARLVGVAYQSLGPVFARTFQLSGAKKAMIVCGAEDLDEISCAGRTNCWRLVESPNPAYRGGAEENGDYDTSDDEAPEQMLTELKEFSLHPEDFGLPAHPLSEVAGGKLPRENAMLLMRLLRNELSPDDPVLHFVLMNTAALLVIAGVCDSDTSHMGEGDDGKVIMERGPGEGRWKEGVRRARYCISSGMALRELEKFSEVTRGFKSGGK